MGYNESDTRAKLITPGLHKVGWTEDCIRREQNAGKIIVVNGKARRRNAKIDYVLRYKLNDEAQPVAFALVEAKAEDLPPDHGLEQVKVYNDSKRFNVPFVYSTNGHLFVEFDAVSKKTSRPRPLSEFPTPEHLRERYQHYEGFNLEDEVAKPLLTPYAGGAEAGRRYYQDAAIRAVMERIASGGDRALLTLATGAGKTYLAVQLMKRLSDAGQMRRALFLCDRDELRTQAAGAFQSVFGNDAAIVSSKHPQKNARVLIATYQTLGVDSEDADDSFLKENYPPDYFSHIVIDECHRSAWGKWSEVLKMNNDAIQIGLTATPRELYEDSSEEDKQITANNIEYFGEPVYEYDIGQGVEDGYLAACEIHKGQVNIDDTGVSIEEILALHPTDARTGQPIDEEYLRELYESKHYEKIIQLPDRVYAMCHDLFEQMLARNGDPHQKTIIFCTRDTHAQQVAITMGNIYADWCQANGVQPKRYYTFKATGTSYEDHLPDMKGSSQSHFIASTVELLTTGVDVPRLENIAFFRYMSSPINFYQMIGRGTRIYAPNNKLMFRVYDYTNATRLFGEDFVTKIQGERKSSGEGGEEHESEPIISVEGLDVFVNDAGRYILTTINGQQVPLSVEEYRERLAEELRKEAATIAEFRALWVVPSHRHDLLAKLPNGEISVRVMQSVQDMDAYDLFDVLAELGYGVDAKTRQERAHAFEYKHREWLNTLPNNAAETLRAIAAQFVYAGIDSLESRQLFQTPAVRSAGGLRAIRQLGKPLDVIQETKKRIYVA